jgi:CTP synthase
VGKGIASASIGKILQSRGFEVTAMKIDPYVNVDAGTMNPTEHGEVFVLDDGTECDQDMGNYERFLDRNLSRANYMTTGSIYLEVIQKERRMEYKGKCVEVVPQVPMAIIDKLNSAAKQVKADFVIVEIGGTVGEYQNILFLEAVRMLKSKKSSDVLLVLVSLLPTLPGGGNEIKSKPTQYAVRTLNAAGLQPDIIIGRASIPLDNKRKQTISLNCNIDIKDIISAPNVSDIHEIPLNFEKDDLSNRILRKLHTRPRKHDLAEWKKLVFTKETKKPVKIGIVGKYFGSGNFVLTDSYISVLEAIRHAAIANRVKAEIDWIDAEEFEKKPKLIAPTIKKYDGIVVPGGFGSRGVEGKIAAIKYAREGKIPFLGLCYGMQLATIEFARNVCGLKRANTTEIDPKTPYPVIHIMPEQEKKMLKSDYGGTMRLGAYPCKVVSDTKTCDAYKTKLISERHRHRFEFNNKYRDILTKKGLVIAGTSPDDLLVEIIELKNHPFFIASQFHPEFKSRPLRPHPLFLEFIKAAIK